MPALAGSIARTAAASPLGIRPFITETCFLESFSLNVPIFTPISLAATIATTTASETITSLRSTKNRSPINAKKNVFTKKAHLTVELNYSFVKANVFLKL